MRYYQVFSVRKYGGTLSVPLTPAFRELRIKEGDRVSVSVDDSKIIIRRVE